MPAVQKNEIACPLSQWRYCMDSITTTFTWLNKAPQPQHGGTICRSENTTVSIFIQAFRLSLPQCPFIKWVSSWQFCLESQLAPNILVIFCEADILWKLGAATFTEAIKRVRNGAALWSNSLFHSLSKVPVFPCALSCCMLWAGHTFHSAMNWEVFLMSRALFLVSCTKHRPPTLYRIL